MSQYNDQENNLHNYIKNLEYSNQQKTIIIQELIEQIKILKTEVLKEIIESNKLQLLLLQQKDVILKEIQECFFKLRYSNILHHEELKNIIIEQSNIIKEKININTEKILDNIYKINKEQNNDKISQLNLENLLYKLK
jgi:hypothetical protein